MGTKNAPGEFDCYEKALPDEPMFVLLARDQWAPHAVERWAARRMLGVNSGERAESEMGMVIEALLCAKAMREWRRENFGKWRAPPVARGDEVAEVGPGTWSGKGVIP